MYLVECKPDAVLVQVLTGASRKNIVHAGNKSELLRRLTEHFTNSKGLVDEDPESHQPPRLKKFEETQNLEKYAIKVLHQKGENNTLIMLCPRLENWIIKAAHEANVKPEKYGLPNSPEELHRLINARTENFKRLVEDVKGRSERVRNLKFCLQSV